MKAIQRRILKLEGRYAKTVEEAQKLLRIVLRSVERQPQATCRRVRDSGGMMFETISFHGMAMSGIPADSPDAREAARFLAWVETTPIDGVEREFRAA
jgi:hypothetical protein